MTSLYRPLGVYDGGSSIQHQLADVLTSHIRDTHRDKTVLIEVEHNISDVFNYKLNPKDKDLFFRILDKLDEIMIHNGLTYFLGAGSLLGSYRHHSLIPWDDDLD